MIMIPAPEATSPERYAADILATIIGDDSNSRMYWDIIDPGYADSADFGGLPAADPSTSPVQGPGANTNVSLGGAADFGFFRSLLEQGMVPTTEDFDAVRIDFGQTPAVSTLDVTAACVAPR